MGKDGSHSHHDIYHLHFHRPRPRREPLGTARRAQLNLITNPIHDGSTSTLSDVESVPLSENKTNDSPPPEADAPSKQRGSEATLKGNGSEQALDSVLASVPVVRPRHEASELELFFDLFFVANLTTFTALHKIENRQTLADYVGFITILWSTWLQITIFDVRFASDSLFERMCKLLQLGVMIGFAVAGPGFTFDLETDPDAWKSMKRLALILLVQRLLLCGQYAVTYIFARRHSHIGLPILFRIAHIFVAAMIFLGLAFAFKPGYTGRAWIGFFVVIWLESLLSVALILRYSEVVNNYRLLMQRFGLLTLIILGEGVIAITVELADVLSVGSFDTSTFVGATISAVVIIYCLFWVYFDQLDINRLTTTWSQFLATYMHYPLHLAILLVVQGCAQFVTWEVAAHQVYDFLTRYTAFLVGIRANDIPGDSLANQLSGFLNDTLAVVPSVAPPSELPDALASLANSTVEQRNDTYNEIGGAMVAWTLKGFKYSVPSVDLDGLEDVLREKVSTEFLYFFISAGVILVAMAAVMMLETRKGVVEYAGIGARATLGAVLCLFPLMRTNLQLLQNFLLSQWILPSVLLCYLFVIIWDAACNYLLPIWVPLFRRAIERREQERKEADKREAERARAERRRHQ